jgi:tetratricopeptide (TPR) repeat protein
MQRIVLLLGIIIGLAGGVQAADTAYQKAIRLFKNHHYETAYNLLYSDLKNNDSEPNEPSYLTLGLICLENAKLYRELYRIALAVNLDYYTRLIADDGENRSRLVNLYLGRTLLQTGQFSESTGFFKKFIEDDHTSMSDRQLAQIGIGAAYFVNGKTKLAERHWSELNLTEPTAVAAMADAYSRVGLENKNPAEMCETALGPFTNNGQKIPIQIVNHALGVFARAGRLDESHRLLEKADLRIYFHEETLSKNKVIRFYDAGLLANLSLTHGRAAAAFLEKTTGSANEKIRWAGQFYLCETYEQIGQAEQALQMNAALLADGAIPSALKIRSRIRQAALHHFLGQPAEAAKALDDILESKLDPNTVADVLLTCCRHGWDYSPAVIRAVEASKEGSGPVYAKVNFALGKYHLWKKEYLKAAACMEAGRDKSNKNRIEYNDPLMLINLADAYYYSRQFSEALEIFFEMSKEFPAVRQIQVAMQGVYSMEQQSAGDAKIF